MRNLIQTALDNAFNGAVKAYWQRKIGSDADEYIVYSLDGDVPENFADDEPLTKTGSVTLRYYYREKLLDTRAGRLAVESRENAIAAAVEAAGFTIPNGKFDAGDVDDIGYGTTIFECEYWRVV